MTYLSPSSVITATVLFRYFSVAIFMYHFHWKWLICSRVRLHIHDARTYRLLQIDVPRTYGSRYSVQVKWGLMIPRHVRRLHLRKVHDDSHGTSHGARLLQPTLMSSLAMFSRASSSKNNNAVTFGDKKKTTSPFPRFVVSHAGKRRMKANSSRICLSTTISDGRLIADNYRR